MFHHGDASQLGHLLRLERGGRPDCRNAVDRWQPERPSHQCRKGDFGRSIGLVWPPPFVFVVPFDRLGVKRTSCRSQGIREERGFLSKQLSLLVSWRDPMRSRTLALPLRSFRNGAISLHCCSPRCKGSSYQAHNKKVRLFRWAEEEVRQQFSPFVSANILAEFSL